MQILIGFALCLVFFLCLGITGYICYRIGNKKKTKTELPQLTEQEQFEIKQKEIGFKNVMNYDYEQAMGLRGRK